MHRWGLMPWNVYHSPVEGSCPGMLVIHLLKAHALGCLSFNARKMVPHAYCISSCCRCIVIADVGRVDVVFGSVVVVVDESLKSK